MEVDFVKNFSFDFVDLPSVDSSGNIINKKPFVEKVERVLKSDLQQYNSFGCEIRKCHTHAGSKLHFNNFIEAELLFQNSYYNKGFAQLTCDWILEKCLIREKNQLFYSKKKKQQIKNILLFGYETYSELFLHELFDILSRKTQYMDTTISFCIYETLSKSLLNGERQTQTRIRNLKHINDSFIEVDKNGKTHRYNIEDTLCIFIVPINTSLSTMDKMIAKLQNYAYSATNSLVIEKICLITLSSSNNSFFKYSNYCLLPEKGKFENLNTDEPITNLVYIDNISAYPAKKCPDCFPDRNIEKPTSIIAEKPIFGVNRGSIVPMLKIGQKRDLEPINKNNKIISTENLSKVYDLANFLTYNHINRGENHFQYYFHTNKYLQKEKEKIVKFLEFVKGSFETDKTIQVFDYLIAPRHSSNASWVHLVNKYIFDGQARIIYFDVEKEYRSNFKAKYSDLTASLESIQSSNQDFLIRFHFVDDVIQSGETFLRTKNILSSLLTVIRDKKNFSLFDSIILLINRLSKDTQQFYLEKSNMNKFLFYVNVNISPMRSYEDACTLCKLIADYYAIRKECAFNFMADICTDVINCHKIMSSVETNNKYLNNATYSEIEKKYIFFITHLLNERIGNKFSLEIGDDNNLPINIEEDENKLKEILYTYYDFNNIKKCFSFINESTVSNAIWQIAFIKAISRPFFTYHIRCRQAAFSFCLKVLSDLLENAEDKTNILDIEGYNKPRATQKISNVSSFIIENYFNILLLQTLVKALTDLNANFLVRADVFDILLKYAKKGDRIHIKTNEILQWITNEKELTHKGTKNIDVLKRNLIYIRRRIFTSNSLIHYTKKNLVLSREASKSLLLEYVLLKKDEMTFFKDTTIDKSYLDEFVENNSISTKGIMYFENNTILKNILSSSINLEKLIKETTRSDNPCSADTLYFFENFKEIWSLNTDEKSDNLLCKYNLLFCKYKELVENIDSFIEKPLEKREDLSALINVFFETLTGNKTLQSLIFVHDRNEKNPLFQFFTLAGDPAKGKNKLTNCKFANLLTSQAFFHDNNISEIRNNLQNKHSDIFFIADTLTSNQETKTLIIRFGKDGTLNRNTSSQCLNQENFDESIYLQVWGFDINDKKHWFALKLLFTLRENFVNLIKNINIKGLIEERKVEMQKIALSINKATTHAQAQKYFKHKIFDQIKDKNIEVINNSEKATRQQYKDVVSLPNQDYEFVLYDTYYQLLSDEFISSLYRKIVRREKGIFETEENKLEFNVLANILIERFSNTEQNVRNIFGISQLNSQLYISDIGQKIFLKFNFNIPEARRYKKHNNWKRMTSFEPIINIINLMAMNVIQHKEDIDLENELFISFSEYGIDFKNKINPSSVDKILENIDIYTHIPPWLFDNPTSYSESKGGNHITLWTLIQSGIQENTSDSVKVDVKIQNDTFIISLNLFYN